jgi:Stress responsive A/B Barrel Domain
MLMTFKDTATDEQIDAALAGLGTMPALVPGILRYEFGLDLEVMEGNPDLALIADFASEDDWRAYLTHPEHEAISATVIAPIKGTMTRIQYLVED